MPCRIHTRLYAFPFHSNDSTRTCHFAPPYRLRLQLSRTQKNKATSHHVGLLKAKLAKLRRELLDPAKGSGGGGAGVGFDVAKTGSGRVGFIGFPSVGKSTLMSKLTGTHSEGMRRVLCALSSSSSTSLFAPLDLPMAFSSSSRRIRIHDTDDRARCHPIQGRQDTDPRLTGNY